MFRSTIARSLIALHSVSAAALNVAVGQLRVHLDDQAVLCDGAVDLTLCCPGSGTARSCPHRPCGGVIGSADAGWGCGTLTVPTWFREWRIKCASLLPSALLPSSCPPLHTRRSRRRSPLLARVWLSSRTRKARKSTSARPMLPPSLHGHSAKR